MTVKYVTDLLKNPRRIILSPWRRASRSLRDTGWQSPVVDHETKLPSARGMEPTDARSRGRMHHTPHTHCFMKRSIFYICNT